MRFFLFSPGESRSRGFTTLEILIVLGVVLLLVGITFPIITKVKQAGQQTTCASNLRQISFALQAYLQDSHGFYPLPQTYGDNCTWAHRLLSYTKTPSVFECPTYPQGSFASACSQPDMEEDPPRWFNGGYDLNNTQPPHQLTLTQNSIRQPSNMVIICDAAATGAALTDPKAPTITTVTDLIHVEITARHGQGVNALFADGHVKWLSLEKLLDKSLWKYR